MQQSLHQNLVLMMKSLFHHFLLYLQLTQFNLLIQNRFLQIIEKDNFGLDPNLINQHITSKTKAIVPMDYGGLSCKILELKKIAHDNNLMLIEDGAESLGSSVNGVKTGQLLMLQFLVFVGIKFSQLEKVVQLLQIQKIFMKKSNL